jgi:hypothetical protein
MDRELRRALKQQARETRSEAGVYQIRNLRSGQTCGSRVTARPVGDA